MEAKFAGTLLPKWWEGVKKNHVSVQKNFKLCFFDTETVYGQVFATGFFNGEKRFGPRIRPASSAASERFSFEAFLPK